mgnify:CR=1 FL=1|jgi:serine-type D-Ala-D-Ala carboxypeptidase (penicillin-binding protein 5/6)
MIIRITFVLFLALCAGLQAAAPVVNAKSAILFDANSGRVLFKKNENAPRAVASTQKLLTALLVAEAGNLSKRVTITVSDTRAQPTKLYLKPGDSYTRKELLTALLVKSPNDVARALARDNAGSVGAFAKKMNARMVQLGGKDSHFVTPNGLPADGQHSTARDMARVARTAYFHPEIREIVRMKTSTFRFANGKTKELRNTNRVLRSYTFCNGMKTGYTNAAGFCLIASGAHRGKEVIALVYGDTKSRVWPDAADLLAFGLGLDRSEMAALQVASAGSRK